MENLKKELKIFIEKNNIDIEENLIKEILYNQRDNIKTYKVVQEIKNKIEYKKYLNRKVIYISEYR